MLIFQDNLTEKYLKYPYTNRIHGLIQLKHAWNWKFRKGRN